MFLAINQVGKEDPYISTWKMNQDGVRQRQSFLVKYVCRFAWSHIDAIGACVSCNFTPW